MISTHIHTHSITVDLHVSLHKLSVIPRREQLLGRFEISRIVELMKSSSAHNFPPLTVTRTKVETAFCGKHKGSPGQSNGSFASSVNAYHSYKR